MRFRLPTGAVPLIPLATLAVCAEDPVADPGMVRFSYRQRSSIEAGDAGGRGEQFMLGAQILADWAVKSADDRRIVLAGKVRDAYLECDRSHDPVSDSDLDPGETCSAIARSGELEVVVTRAGASLAGDLVSFLRGAQILHPGSTPRQTTLPGFALEAFRVAITSAAFEAFSHLLAPARGVTSEVRRVEVKNERGQPAGTFEISYP